MRNLLFITLLFLNCQGRAQTSDQIADVVLALAKKMRKNYVLVPEADQMADLLENNLKNGNYSEFTLNTDFANQLQKDLRSVKNDKHLRIRKETGNNSSSGSHSPYGPSLPDGIGEVKILDGQIALFAMSHFPGANPAYRSHVKKTIDEIRESGARALIIDMRQNRGGSPDGVREVCSYFLPPDVLLNSLYFRNRDVKNDFYTKKVNDPLLDIPVVLLTSNLTFSGGEEFCYNLKNLKRATLIGEVTGGGAHPVNGFSLPHGFTAIIPVGMAISPITGTNWEGVGVAPDQEVPASEALETAVSFLNK